MNELSAYELGEYDALMGYDCRTDECEDYYSGYATVYAQQECQTGQSLEAIQEAAGLYDKYTKYGV
jgi:hypothetical protein